MLNECNLFLNLFYYQLTIGYWLLKSPGGNLGGEVALHVQGWNTRSIWGMHEGKDCPVDVAPSRNAGILTAVGKADRTILERSVDGWGVPWEALTKAGFATPVVFLKPAVYVILDIRILLKILLQSVERVTQSMIYSRAHWINVFFLISGSVGEGRDLFHRNKLMPLRRRNLLSPLAICGLFLQLPEMWWGEWSSPQETGACLCPPVCWAGSVPMP